MKKLIVLLALLLATPAHAIMLVGFGGGGGGANIAYDSRSASSPGTGNLSWTNTPVGTLKGVVVYVLQDGGGLDHISGVTYGGVAMTEVAGSPLLKADTEAMAVYTYFLGANIPAGAQTVVATSTSATYAKKAYVIGVTASGDMSVTDTTTISSDSVANPSATLSLGGVESFCVHGGLSGHDDPASLTTPAGWTDTTSTDFGAVTAVFEYYNTVASDDVTFGQTQTAEDFVSIGVAIRVAP